MTHVIDIAQYRERKQIQQEQMQSQANSYWLLYRTDRLPNDQEIIIITAVPWVDMAHYKHIQAQYGERWKPLLNEWDDELVERCPWSWSDPLASLLTIIENMKNHSSPIYQETGQCLARRQARGILHIVQILPKKK